MRLLEGAVIPEDEETPTGMGDLRAEIYSLRKQLAHANHETKAAQRQADQALGSLRKQLSPLYRALQQVFGELDAANVDDADAPTGGRDARQMAILKDWKVKNPPADGTIIDALLLHDSMTVTQMSSVCKLSKNTIYPATSRMGRGGILVNNGGRFSLK